ncbi:MAG: DUF2911 domain-containing protein [Acidobacteria bacterium]|nr:DUF2911 domain-containing protein [Acidobacteriota bacterium]
MVSRICCFHRRRHLVLNSRFCPKGKTIGIDKEGEFHVSSPIRIGDRIVEKGMYQIYRVDINTTPFIVIRKVAMTYFGKTMGSMKRGDEVVRLKCTIQRVDEQNKKSNILFLQALAEERVALQVWFRHEKSNVFYRFVSCEAVLTAWARPK